MSRYRRAAVVLAMGLAALAVWNAPRPADAREADGAAQATRAAVPAGPVHALYPSGNVGDLPYEFRGPACVSRNQFRFVAVYARPADAPDRFSSTAVEIRRAVMRANAFVAAEARRLGVGRFDLKFQCRSDGLITVLNAVLRTSSFADSFASIENDLRRLNLDDWRAKYWVWYDDVGRDGVCGEARRPGDGSLSESNRANQGPDYAVAYAPITSCGSVASTLLHEATHTMGAVAHDAWGTDRRGHCTDGLDVMCSSGNLCSSLRYDCGADSYFDPRPRRGEYLYSHWNVAFCLNRFVSRSGCITHPRDLRASSTGYGVALRWRPPAVTGGAPVARYEIQRRNCRDCPWNTVDQVRGSRTSYTDFTFGFRYEYRVRAVNVWEDAGPVSNVAAGGIL